jgi:photosystem II stability/assembly factor-like uncharacterized protein
MRGPNDDLVEVPGAARGQGQAHGDLGQESRAVEPPQSRPPGGNVLLRQLQLLESAGYLDLASDKIEAAVSGEGHQEAVRFAARFAASPPPENAEDRGLRRGRARTFADEGAAPENAGEASVEQIAQEYLQVGQQLGPPTANRPQWRSIGPWTVPNGQTYGASRVNVSGRVSSIAIDPQDPAHVLVGAANGGVWESRDRGGSWQPRTDFEATLAVGAIAFDPRNPLIVYCCTGEGNGWSYLGAGILRSSDGGTSWDTLCTAPFVGHGFYDFHIDPADSRHLLGATTNGLYVSTDGGVNWARRRATRTWSLALTPAGAAPAEVLAACNDGLWRSTDGGTTWTAVVLPGAPATFKRLAVVIAPSNPTVAYVWGAGPPEVFDPRVRRNAPTAYLWRRAGGSWTMIAKGVAATGTPPNVLTHQAWYDWFLAVAPDRDTQVYCGAIEVHRGDLSDGTWTWRTITNKGPSGDSIHPDQHAMAFEPGHPDTIYVGNDGGLYRSPDRGIKWEHCNNGLVISEFEYLAQHPGSSRWLIGGTQDNGTARWTGSDIWDHVADGDGGDCGVNRTSPPTVFHTYYNMSPERSTRSGDGGTWEPITPPVPPGEGSLFYPPFESTATTGDTIAIGGDALYISRNNGGAWTRVPFPSAGRSSALYIPNADTVYVATIDGRIFRTRWAGGNWSALSALATPRAGAYVSDLFVDTADPNRLWATHRTTGGGRVFRSDDGGSTWSDRTAGLPGLPINAIEVDPANRNRLWVAADLGVYETLDGGASWTDFANGLPNAYVGDLVFQPYARVLRAGTRNRGVWEIPVDGLMTQPVCGVQWSGTLTGNETKRWVTHSWPATWNVVWTVMPTSVRPGGPQVSWTVQVERASPEHVTYWLNVRNLSPDAVNVEGRFCILSRY